jgi:hypothetical protein
VITPRCGRPVGRASVARGMGAELRVDSGDGRPPQTIGLAFAAIVALAVSLLAWGVRATLDRLTGRAAVVWTALAVTVLLVSFVPVYYVEASSGTKVALVSMHLAVAAVLVPVLGRRKA